jgi:hypothetical protein
MTYWTVLVFTVFGGDFDGVTHGVLYKSYEDCFAAHQIVSETLGYDHKLECVELNVLSGSIRPVKRPEGLVK